MSGTATDKEKVEASLFRYRIAAYLVGTLLILAVVASYSVHGVPAWTGAPHALTTPDGPDFLWIWIFHGWFYVVYLILAFDFYRRTRWPLPRLAEMIVAGLLPGLTFVIERRVSAYAASRGIGS